MKEIWNAAREKLKGFCRVCPVCDGRACAGEVPGMGGLGSGASFKNNIAALASYRLRMRVIHEITEPDISTDVLGLKLSMPVMAAPIGGTSYNMGENSISERRYITSVIQGCLAAGTRACTGDGPLAEIFTEALFAIKEAAGAAIPFIKPWEGREAFDKIQAALDAGCTIIGMDIDAIGLVTLRKMGRPVSPKNRDQLAAIAEYVHSHHARLIAKGIMTREDAALACEAGVDGIVVSNHGGRVLDHTPGTAEVLSEIAEAVKGKTAVLVDGGVRSGVDVLKMRALGADAVLIGRPCSLAVVGEPENGLEKYLNVIRQQLMAAMILTGMPDLQSVGKHILQP